MKKNNSNKQTRPETGPMQFGSDWPGVFIRGDNAGYYAMILKDFLENPESVKEEPIMAATLGGLVQILQSSNAFGDLKELQLMKEFENATTRNGK